MLRALGNGEAAVTVANQLLPWPACSHPSPCQTIAKPRRQHSRRLSQSTHVNVTAAGVTSSSENPQGGHICDQFLASP